MKFFSSSSEGDGAVVADKEGFPNGLFYALDASGQGGRAQMADLAGFAKMKKLGEGEEILEFEDGHGWGSGEVGVAFCAMYCIE